MNCALPLNPLATVRPSTLVLRKRNGGKNVLNTISHAKSDSIQPNMKSNRQPYHWSALAFLIGIATCGCDVMHQWDIATSSDGRVYRLNRQTGEVAFVTTNQLVRLSLGPEYNPEAPAHNHPHNFTNNPIQPLGQMNVKFRTKWRGGNLNYALEAGPITAQAQSVLGSTNGYPILLINLHDSDHFQLISVPVSFKGMTRVYGTDGKLLSLLVQGQVPFALQEYEAISTGSIGWAGMPDQ